MRLLLCVNTGKEWVKKIPYFLLENANKSIQNQDPSSKYQLYGHLERGSFDNNRFRNR